MCIGLFAPAGFAQVGPDVIILGTLLVWFIIARNSVTSYALLAFQLVSCAVNIHAIGAATDSRALTALFVHMLFRVVAIALIIAFLIQRRRGKAQDAAEVL
jgi:hypothetical protein